MNNHNIEREVKLNKLKDGILNGELAVYHNAVEPYPVTNRQTIKEYVCGKLHIHDPHIVNGWIDELVGEGVLSHNPTTQRTKRGFTKPSNDTRYFIHLEKITHTHIADSNINPHGQ